MRQYRYSIATSLKLIEMLYSVEFRQGDKSRMLRQREKQRVTERNS